MSWFTPSRDQRETRGRKVPGFLEETCVNIGFLSMGWQRERKGQNVSLQPGQRHKLAPTKSFSLLLSQLHFPHCHCIPSMSMEKGCRNHFVTSCWSTQKLGIFLMEDIYLSQSQTPSTLTHLHLVLSLKALSEDHPCHWSIDVVLK
jgi:hypothetical protein